jgi:hypothetical protein
LRGWVITNLGTKNSGLPGDVILSWFKPLDSSFDNPNDVTDQIYLLVVNGFTGPDGTAAEYRQRIQLNFATTIGTTIQRLNSDAGVIETIPLGLVSGRRQLDIQLDGGEGQLFKFNTGDPFIGVEPSADFDLDGDVDGGDFLRWQQGIGGTAPVAHGAGDANLDLKVDAGDLNIWKSQLTASPSFATNLAIPEPTGGLLAAMNLVALTSLRDSRLSRKRPL